MSGLLLPCVTLCDGMCYKLTFINLYFCCMNVIVSGICGSSIFQCSEANDDRVLP
jgi:hypothetical protein